MNVKKAKVFEAIFETILDNDGISSITVGEIAQRAGIGKGSVYMYFANKEQMIYEALNYLVQTVTEKLIEYEPDVQKGFKETLCEFLKNQIVVMECYSKIFYSSVSAEFFPMLTPEMRIKMIDVISTLKKKYQGKVLKIISLGAREGVIPKEHTPFEILAATQLLMSMSGHFVQKDVPVICDDVDEHVLMMYDMAVKMLS